MEVSYSKKKFMILWLGQLFSIVGSGITGFALSVSVYQKTGMAMYYSFITLSTMGPSILIRPIAGALADKYSRRKLMIFGYILAASGVFLIAVLMKLNGGNISIVQICLCMAISSIGNGISIPAYTSSISLLIPEDFYAQASGMLQISASGQYLISPLAAGILLPLIGVNKILLIDVLTFAAVILIVVWIKVPLKVSSVDEQTEEPLLQQMKMGISYLRKSKANFSMIITGLLSNMFMGFLVVLIGPMILSFASAEMLGIGESISAIGMVIGSVLVMIWKLPGKIYNTVYTYVITMGIGYMLIGVTVNYVFIIFACILFFYSMPFVNTYIDVAFRKTIDQNMQGRIYSIHGALIQIGYVISYSLAGILADYVFEPMFKQNGKLVNTIGKIIGVGAGRGIAFMFILSGFCVVIMGIFLKARQRKIEEEILA